MPGFEALSSAIRTAALEDTGSDGLFQTGSPLLTGGIYTSLVPQDPTFPFAVIVQTSDVDTSDFDNDMFHIRVQLSMYAQRTRGMEQCDQFIERARVLYHRKNLTLSGWVATAGRMFASINVQESTEIIHRAAELEYWVTRVESP